MRFKKLKIYENAMLIVKDVYALSKKLPREENYNLCQQMTRAAVSIPSNIAEGSGKSTDADFSKYISIANGSCCELYCQIEIVKSIYPQEIEKCEDLLNKINKLSREIKNFKMALQAQKNK